MLFRSVLCDSSVENTAELITSMHDGMMPEIPVIAVIDSRDEEGYVYALDCGAADVITKPVRPQIALVRVKAALLNSSRQIDSLTGYTSELFQRAATELIANHPSSTYLISCFDIDNFKAVNAQ